MALKADRYEESTDISHFYVTAPAVDRGGVVCLELLSASGAAMDQGDNTVSYQQAATTDVPVGILLNDVVNKDLTRTHLNQYKDEVQLGGKVTVMTRGWVVTNMIDGAPGPGDLAYASDAGGTAGYLATVLLMQRLPVISQLGVSCRHQMLMVTLKCMSIFQTTVHKP